VGGERKAIILYVYGIALWRGYCMLHLWEATVIASEKVRGDLARAGLIEHTAKCACGNHHRKLSG